MSKHKKFGKVHISRMGYDLSKFYTAPRRKRERSLSEPRESKEKAAQGVSSTQSGGVETGLTVHISTSSLPKNEEDCKR